MQTAFSSGQDACCVIHRSSIQRGETVEGPDSALVEGEVDSAEPPTFFPTEERRRRRASQSQSVIASTGAQLWSTRAPAARFFPRSRRFAPSHLPGRRPPFQHNSPQKKWNPGPGQLRTRSYSYVLRTGTTHHLRSTRRSETGGSQSVGFRHGGCRALSFSSPPDRRCWAET